MKTAPTALLPAPPYYIVAFSSVRTDKDQGYDDMAEQMVELAKAQPGFLGMESARGQNGFGITNSYWSDEAAIRARKQVTDHLAAQVRGRQDWYSLYRVRIGKVDRAYGFDVV